MSGRWRPQAGVATLELLLTLPVLLLFLAAMVYFGRYFAYYTAAHKAAHDAARYLATVSRREFKSQVAGTAQVPAVLLAQNIAQQETAGLHPGPSTLAVVIDCVPDGCTGLSVPDKIRVLVQMQVTDELLTPFSWTFLGDQGLLLRANVTMLYVGQ
ncbi:TadE/TadG family type IV pilus assembly protein [Duganella fentianensis]|uniref:TadE/TadG family type IV pilus assembly protein n=1 Tax=Duganella fentianensis TaxID=2692177 RepID=UPI0032B13A47